MQRNKFCEPISSVDDWKLDYLTDFVDFLRKWKTACSGNERLCLSSPTFEAILQTTNGIVNLSRHLLQMDEWKYLYVLPGQFVSDPIEKR